jgi:flavodoxin
MDVGIIFYSKTGNTKKIAERIKEYAEKREHNVHIIEVIPEKQPGFLKAGHSSIRQKDLPIKNGSIDASSWDIVLIGCPIWAGKPAPFIKTILQKTSNLHGKKTSMFITCSGSPEDKTLDLLKSYLIEKQADVSSNSLVVHMDRKGKIKKEKPFVKDFACSVLK